jgi:hypothetical protein
VYLLNTWNANVLGWDSYTTNDADEDGVRTSETS